jgi:hypothetical protein
VSLRDRGPFKVETLGHALRVVDKNGGDVCLVGDARKDEHRAIAEFIATVMNCDCHQ